jgi:hypothetical protein
VPRIERLLSTFVLGFAASEVNGRFGTGGDGLRRRRVPPDHPLAPWLDLPVDWDAEFEADLTDLVTVIESVSSGRRSGG